MSVRVIRPASAFLATAALTAVLSTASARAQTPIKFTLDGRIEAPAAPFLMAVDRGYFKSEDVDVTVDPAATPPLEPITRVASGAFDIGVADINTLIRWRDLNPAVPVKAVFIVHNKPSYAVVGRKSRGVAAPKDLEDKKLGAPAAEPASAAWPIFAKLNGIDTAKVTVLNVGLPVREPMLAAGELDAITAVSFGAPINLREKGVPADDITMLLMADYGLDLYGNAIIVNPKFLAEKPDAVRAFLRGFVKGLKDTIRDPGAAIAAVIRRNPLNREVELERLQTILKLQVLTPEARANGLGEIDEARFEKAIDQIGLAHAFKTKPKAADVYDAAFLPPDAERNVD